MPDEQPAAGRARRDAAEVARARTPRLVTVGHGTAGAEAFAELLTGAGVASLVDVRTAPGSRRFPHFGRDELAGWLPAAGVAYRWEPALGGWRRPRPDSVNTALRSGGFRGYADYMRTEPFWAALDRVLAEAAATPTAVMCSESRWWRCHRRLLADAAMLVRGAEVVHLGHDGRLEPHRPTGGVRVDGALLAYDLGSTPSLLEP